MSMGTKGFVIMLMKKRSPEGEEMATTMPTSK
jgi:hypothetical protein